MSSFAVTSERLTITEHPNADALELAVVGAYRAVVRKGQYKTGDFAVYIPEQAIVPEELLVELGLTGRLAGAAHNRVKAVRLRGELSQGIVCSPEAVSEAHLIASALSGADLSETLGITKWVPTVPVHFGGEVKASAEFWPWIDIENLKRFPDIFEDGEEVEATEKIHGSAACFTWTRETGLLVSSKGLGSQHLTITEAEGNLYWRAARAYKIEEACEVFAELLDAHTVALYGEVYGSGVQDLTYGGAQNVINFSLFDARSISEGAPDGKWVGREALALLASKCELGQVPVLYRGPYDYETLLALADGPESVSGKESHTREGVVIRSVPERYSAVLGGRAIAKLVGSDYLTRKGGTEYE
jgi:RNA ligase (TIGR02306 family)